MNAPSAFPRIPVSAAKIIQQVGHRTYLRGKQYMQEGKVARYSYDAQAHILTGTTYGDATDPYLSKIVFPAKQVEGSLAFSARCTCPVRTDCKHSVAIMLTAIERAEKVSKAQSSTQRVTDGLSKEQLKQHGITTAQELAEQQKMSTWRRTLSQTLAQHHRIPYENNSNTIAALDLKMHVNSRFALGSGQHKTPRITLQARPLVQGKNNRWIKDGINWEHFQKDHTGKTSSHALRPQHERWLREFYSIIRPWQSAYTSHRDWVTLSTVNSSLLWKVLKKAEKIALPILLEGTPITTAHTEEATLKAELHSYKDGLRITPTLTAGENAFPAYYCHPIGQPRNGFIALGHKAQEHYKATAQAEHWETTLPSAINPTRLNDQYAAADLIFIPLKETLNGAAETLIREEHIEIPSQDINSFYQEFYPYLTRNISFCTNDATIQPPQVQQPELILHVYFDSEQTPHAHTRWEWEYPKDPLKNTRDESNLEYFPVQSTLLDIYEQRDKNYENTILAQLKNIYPALQLTEQHFYDWDVQQLTESILPQYRDVHGLRIQTHGQEPQFTELDVTPEIQMRVEPSDTQDWFDLGIIVTIGQWTVSFSTIFEALNAGKKHILLGDGNYYPLNRPEFIKLRQLLTEIEDFSEPDQPLSLNKHQLGMWEELEELATTTQSCQGWQESIHSLLSDKDSSDNVPTPATLQAQLRPYQEEGYQWLYFLWKHRLGAVLGDDMGLGKTLQTISMMLKAYEQWVEELNNSTPSFAPFLIIAPTSVVPNWVQELERFAPELEVAAITTSTAKSQQTLTERIGQAQVVITSYTLLRLDSNAFNSYAQETPWNGVILDEAQFIKNARTQAHQIARKIPARFKLAVTGTPMENNLMELWSIFSLVAPGLFPSARKFKDYYVQPITESKDHEKLEQLRQRIRPLILRRTKELVATELPDKTDQRMPIALNPEHRKAYDMLLQQERKKVLGLLKDMDKNRFTVFRSLTKLRMMALAPHLVDEDYSHITSSKLEYLQAHLPEVLSQGHRVLIFSQFTSYLKTIAKDLEEQNIEFCYLDGSTKDRAKVIEQFEKGESSVFLISLKAGGFGLNLTSADYCFLMDPWWNPAAEQQAIDRIHRIGQTRHVMVYRLIAAGTIEEKVMELQKNKSALFDAVVDDGDFFSEKMTAEHIRELLSTS
ncbi:SNF2-related protein [Rothia sp. P6271]|uniref:DEAD/DEAH box helicase n=1 Tax=Rothia sp. P6271 TaxID=3402659 RepID=UPI003AD7CBFF